MKIKLIGSILITIFLIVSNFISDEIAFATTRTSAGTGNWNTGATWSPVGVPAANDIVIIANGHTVTVDVSTAIIKSLTINSGGTIDFSAGGQLNLPASGLGKFLSISGTLTINNGGILSIAGSPITVYNGGTLTVNSTGGGIDGALSNLTINSGGTFTMDVSGGDAYCNGFIMSGTMNANSGSGSVYASSNSTVNGTITTSGTFSSTQILNINGNLTIGGTAGVGASTFGGNYTVFGNITLSSGSTVNYQGAAQTVDNTLTYSNLTLSVSGTKTIGGTLSVNGNVTISGTAAISNASSNVSIGGSLTNNSGTQSLGTGTYTFSGTTISGSGALDFSSGTVSFSGANITLGSGVGGGNLTFAATNFTNTNAAITLGASSYNGTVNFNNPVNISGTGSSLTFNSGTLNFNSSLTCSGSLTINGGTNRIGSTSGGTSSNVSITGTLTISGGTNDFNGANGNTNKTGTLDAGDFSNSSSTTTVFHGPTTFSGSSVSFGSSSTNTFYSNFTQSNSATGSTCAINGTFNASASGVTTALNAETITLAGTLSSGFMNLNIANSNGTATGSASMTIAGNLTLAKDLSMGANELTLSSATGSNVSGAGEVIGKVTRTGLNSGEFTFNSANTKVNFPSNPTKNLSITLTKSVPTTGAVSRYYDCKFSGTPATVGAVTLTLPYKSSELNGNDEATLKMFRSNDASPTTYTYVRITSTVNTTAHTVAAPMTSSANTDSLGNITNGTHFAFAQANQPLPVELTSFTAKVNGKQVDLKWFTATEINNYGFDIERKNLNSDFAKIGFIEGNGTKNTPTAYTFNDLSPLSGKNIYRLKQIDRDGTIQYSQEVEVAFAVGIGLQQNYPNPFNPSTTIQFSIPQSGNATLKVFDLVGKEIATLFNEFTEKGMMHSIDFDGRSIPSGTYIYTLQSGKYTETKRMTVIK